MESIDTYTRHGYTATVTYDLTPTAPDEETLVGILAYDIRTARVGYMPPDPYGDGPFRADCPRCGGLSEVRPEGPIGFYAVDEFDTNGQYPESCYLCGGDGQVTDGERLARMSHDAVVCLPVRAWDDRNGTELRIADDWDHADGWIYATAEDVAETLGADASRNDIAAALVDELQQWQDWAQGNVYGVVVTDPSGDEVDSAWGIYGETKGEAERMLSEAVAHLEENPGIARADAIWHGGKVQA